MKVMEAKRLTVLALAAALGLGISAFAPDAQAQQGTREGQDQLQQPRENVPAPIPESDGERPERLPDTPNGGVPGDEGRGDDGSGGEALGPGAEEQDGDGGQGQADAGADSAPEPQSPLGLVMKDGIPKHGGKRAALRDDLYALLASAGNEKEGRQIARQLQRVWAETGSDTTRVLLVRATRAVKAKKHELALELLNSIVELSPDNAEAWNRRAFVHYHMNNYRAAAGDLRRALALDPNHFKALDGLGTIFQQMNDDAKALSVYEKLKDVHPFWPGLDKAIETLRQKVEGRGI